MIETIQTWSETSFFVWDGEPWPSTFITKTHDDGDEMRRPAEDPWPWGPVQDMWAILSTISLSVLSSDSNFTSARILNNLAARLHQVEDLTDKLKHILPKSTKYQHYSVLKCTAINVETNSQIINSIFPYIHIMLLMSDIDINQTTQEEITPCGMRCLRRAVNEAWRSRIRNIKSGLGTLSVMEFVERRGIKRFDKHMRMNPTCPELTTWKWKLLYIQGCSRRWWIHNVFDTMTSQNHHLTSNTVCPITSQATLKQGTSNIGQMQ